MNKQIEQMLLPLALIVLAGFIIAVLYLAQFDERERLKEWNIIMLSHYYN